MAQLDKLNTRAKALLRNFTKVNLQFQREYAEILREFHLQLAQVEKRLEKYSAHTVVHSVEYILAEQFLPALHLMSSTTHYMFMACNRWAENCYPNFILSESLACELLLTDPKNVLWSDIVWPFPVLRLQLPESLISIQSTKNHISSVLLFSAFQEQNTDALKHNIKNTVFDKALHEYFNYYEQLIDAGEAFDQYTGFVAYAPNSDALNFFCPSPANNTAEHWLAFTGKKYTGSPHY